MSAADIETLGREYTDEPAETCDPLYESFVAAVLDAIRVRCPGVEIEQVGCSMGSRYFSIWLPDRESIEIRISNHKLGGFGETVPAWSFETSHSSKLHEMGLTELASQLSR